MSATGVRQLAQLAVALAVSACSDAGPKGYLSGSWVGFEVATDIRFRVERGTLRSFSIAPSPPAGFQWYCPGLTSANAIAADVTVPIVGDSLDVTLPGGSYTVRVAGRFYQITGYLELRAAMILSGPACASATFSTVAFSARHEGE